MGELKRTRSYLVQQMETQTQESADFLGLTLSSVQGGNEQAIMDTMIEALYASGSYRLIELRDLNGRVLASRHDEGTTLPVPLWFSASVPLTSPQASAKVMRGWVQTGTVCIESRLDEAYKNLWQAARNTAIWCGLSWLVFALLGGIVLRSLLRPLKRIEEQAMAVGERRLELQHDLPRTRELRRVVQAMNTMITRIGQIFTEHTAIADKLSQQVYRDPLTGLGNRRYLQSQINARLSDTVNQVFGTFLIIQLQGLKELNEQYGYQQGDSALQNLATRLQVGCRRFSDFVLARLGGGDVALFLPGVDALSAQSLLEEVLLAPANRGGDTFSPVSVDLFSFICGGVYFDQTVCFEDLLAAADMALAKARSAGGNTVQLLTLSGETGLSLQGRMHRKETILNLITEKNIVFYAQPTVQKNNLRETLAYEMYARVVDSSGKHMSLAMYLAVAEQFGLTADLEQMILERLLQNPLRRLLPQPIALNISPRSLVDEDFFSWICQTLVQCGRDGIAFNIEFPESRLHADGERMKKFADVVRKGGHGLGVDHFGQGLINFGYLQWLRPDYVKIDRAIVDEMLRQNQDVHFFIDSLCSVAHSIGVKVVIKNVETENQLQLLSSLNVDAMQGNAIALPELLPSETGSRG
ncbi:MAG: EAL domain-containing protein [Desulfobulbus sp.]|nr:EAL domain-containing protein [Desulfobulbus sp.]